MKTAVKIVTALAAIAGFIYIIATYGEQIVNWCKKTLAALPKCPACEEAEAEVVVEVAAEEPVAEETPVEEAVAEEIVDEPAPEVVVSENEPEVVVAENEPVAAEEDFAE